MILNERDARHEHILQVARQMMTAARTAPKGKGIDIIEVALITDPLPLVSGCGMPQKRGRLRQAKSLFCNSCQRAYNQT